MKKTILTIAALTAFGVNSLFAQVTFGPKLGLNISNVHDKVVDANAYQSMDFKSRVGFNIGGMVNFQLNDFFAIRPELIYTTAGAKLSNSGVETKFNYGYLSLPINLVGSLPINDDLKLQAIVGPYFSLGLGGKNTTEGNGVKVESDIKMKKNPDAQNDPATYLNSLDAGLNFGLGAQYKSFVFSAVYSLGLTNIESHSSNSTIEDNRGKVYKMSNRNFSINVAYLFGGK